MTREPVSPQSPEGELDALRRRVPQLERELEERTARANAAVAAAQDRSYWLDRWQIDLNALMRRRGAAELRSAVRAARAVYRFLYDARSRLRRVPGRLLEVREKLRKERARR